MSLKYDIPPLAQYCENYLIENVKACPPNMEMLELADQMNRERLRVSKAFSTYIPAFLN
jgi:hypothetical protein